MTNPQAEATAMLPDGHGARVLEPSPPAVTDDWFADDPVNSPVSEGSIVSPVGGADLTWIQAVQDHPEISEFAQERWLAAYRPVGPTPVGYQQTMVALHRLAIGAIAPARQQVTGKFGLRWVRGGFGTPFYGDDVQVRVIGTQVLVERDGVITEHPITSIDEVAAVLGATVDIETAAEHDSPPVGPTDERLSVDADHAAFIANWWGLGTAALEQVRADAATVDPGRVQLWPGHFDVGVEFGNEGARASFGASPGDGAHDEPYLYVAAWWPDRLDLGGDSFWNASAFTGAEMHASQLREVSDPVASAVEFYMAARDGLAAAVKETP